MNDNFWSKKLRDQAAREVLEEELAKRTTNGADPGPGLDSKDDHKARMQHLKKHGGNSLILSSLLNLGQIRYF